MDKIPQFGDEIKEKEFTMTDGVTFVNHGSYGTVPRKVQEAQRRIINEMNSNPDVFFRRILRINMDETMKCIADFVNADTEDLVFVQNATTDVRTEYLPLKLPINHNEDDVVEMYREYFKRKPHVKLAVIDHITSPSAIKMPLKKLIPLCKEFGILAIIDGAHAPGQTPLDLRTLDADFYTGNLHKWLYTPRGCAILYINKKHQSWITPVVTSHGHTKDIQTDVLHQGTRDNSPYCVVSDAIQFYNDIGGYDELERLIIDHVVNYNMSCQYTYIDGNVYIRTSANVYNTEEDYHKLCRLICDQME